MSNIQNIRSGPFAKYAAPRAQDGWDVFPLVVGGKVPYAGTRGHLDATQDAARIARWAARHPDSNLGFRPPADVVVLDIDDSQAFSDWCDSARLELPPTFEVATRRGRHYYYRVAENLPWRARMADVAVDIKRSNGYVVAPGSVAKGHVYEATRYQPPDALPTLPDTWLPYLTRTAASPHNTPPVSAGRGPQYYACVLAGKLPGDGRRDCLKWGLRKAFDEQTGDNLLTAVNLLTDTALEVGVNPKDVCRLVAWYALQNRSGWDK